MHHFPKEKLETVFKALDANSDGKVDPEEVKKVKEHQPKEWAQPEFTAWFFDKFKDIDQV
ncbi:EF-hand domain-containing protein [bacterium]|nr:EF-hand domain-containing protein [bacterium]